MSTKPNNCYSFDMSLIVQRKAFFKHSYMNILHDNFVCAVMRQILCLSLLTVLTGSLIWPGSTQCGALSWWRVQGYSRTSHIDSNVQLNTTPRRRPWVGQDITRYGPKYWWFASSSFHWYSKLFRSRKVVFFCMLVAIICFFFI